MVKVLYISDITQAVVQSVFDCVLKDHRYNDGQRGMINEFIKRYKQHRLNETN